MKTIEVTVDQHGNVEVETKGYSGLACLAATDALERVLGKSGVVRFTYESWAVQPKKKVDR